MQLLYILAIPVVMGTYFKKPNQTPINLKEGPVTPAEKQQQARQKRERELLKKQDELRRKVLADAIKKRDELKRQIKENERMQETIKALSKKK